MQRIKVWDPLIRLFHWSLVAAFTTNALFTDAESRLHEWLGYAAAGLIAFRLLWGFIGPRHARFASFTPSPAALTGQIADIATGRRRVHIGHTPLGALMIFNLLACVCAIAATGWMMTTDAFWGIGWVEKLHEALVTWAEISVVAHIAAVLWESRRTRVNLPAAMVTGVKAVPEDANIIP